MRVYWRKVKRGENLILNDENDGHEEELGGFRCNKASRDYQGPKTVKLETGVAECFA